MPGDCIISSLSIPPSTHVAVATESVVYHIQPTTVTILSQSALGQLGSEAIIVTDYTEVELSSNEVAEITEVSHSNTEEMVRKCVEVNTELSPVVAIISDEGAVEEEEMVTASQQEEFCEELQCIRNKQDSKNICEKSTQCDIIVGILGDTGALVPVKAEPSGEKVGQQQEDETHTADGGEEDIREASSTQKEDKCSSVDNIGQTVTPRRGRGRPRKNLASPKEVQAGKRRGRPTSIKVEQAPDKS